MDLHDKHEMRNTVRNIGGVTIMGPQISDRQRQNIGTLMASVATQVPASESSMGSATAPGAVRFIWGLSGMPPDDMTNWIMT